MTAEPSLAELQRVCYAHKYDEQAAKALGIPVRTFRHLCKRHDLTSPTDFVIEDRRRRGAPIGHI